MAFAIDMAKRLAARLPAAARVSLGAGLYAGLASYGMFAGLAAEQASAGAMAQAVAAMGREPPVVAGAPADAVARGWREFGSPAVLFEVASQPAPPLVWTVPAPPPPVDDAPPAPPAETQPAPAPPAPAPPPPPPAPGAGLNTAPMDAASQALFNDTNRRRMANGLPPLHANGLLTGIARIRSQDMADHNYFAHVSPVTGDDAFRLMDRYGVPFGWAGENLAKNNYPDREAVSVADEALWNSAPHRENILNPHFTDGGIALVVDASGMSYFTIVFTGP